MALPGLTGLLLSFHRQETRNICCRKVKPLPGVGQYHQNQPGQQRISISLVLRWEPENSAHGSVREALAFSRGLNINVPSFLGMTRSQASSAGLLGLIAGSIISLTGFFWRNRGVKSSGAITETTPNAALLMETGASIVLSNEDATLLRALFNHHERLIMEDEFLSGYSGARTFLVGRYCRAGKMKPRRS